MACESMCVKSVRSAKDANRFLLARLHVDSLIDQTRPRAVQDALSELSGGSEGLSKEYGKALERIDGQTSGLRRLARNVLMWITYARRELSVSTLR